MKVKLFVHLFQGNLDIHTISMAEHYPLIKEVYVNVPDELLPSEKGQKELQYSWTLGKAQSDIEKKQDELAAAEEVLKNLLAIEYQPEDEL